MPPREESLLGSSVPAINRQANRRKDLPGGAGAPLIAQFSIGGSRNVPPNTEFNMAFSTVYDPGGLYSGLSLVNQIEIKENELYCILLSIQFAQTTNVTGAIAHHNRYTLLLNGSFLNADVKRTWFDGGPFRPLGSGEVTIANGGVVRRLVTGDIISGTEWHDQAINQNSTGGAKSFLSLFRIG